MTEIWFSEFCVQRIAGFLDCVGGVGNASEKAIEEAKRKATEIVEDWRNRSAEDERGV